MNQTSSAATQPSSLEPAVPPSRSSDTQPQPPGSTSPSQRPTIDDPQAHVERLGQRAREACRLLAVAGTAQKNDALLAIAAAIEASRSAILEANAADLAGARERGIDNALLDRLELTDARVDSMIKGLRDVAAQADPVGALSATDRRPSGLEIARMRVPLGVIGVIYESRPNVTVDAAALCLKAGNSVILRGGTESFRSNQVIAACIARGLAETEMPAAAVQLVGTTDRAAVGALLALEEYIDVIIPRGGKGLVSRISAEARVPVIKHLDGICHVYVHAEADLDMALAVAVNSKTYRYGICGSMETLLVHRREAGELLPRLVDAFDAHGVELRGCPQACELASSMTAATEEDWATEYLGPVLSIRIVDDLDAAVEHITRYGSGHTDGIVTGDIAASKAFVRQVDSSSVLVNAATCFADGAEYGLGAEIGISTNRLHVRGPVGVLGLTTEKYVVIGDGTVRV